MNTQGARKILIVSVLLLILSTSLSFSTHVQAKPVNTDVGGIIASDTTWILANSPYIVISDVVAQNGATLTVESGVEIRFFTGTSLYVDGGFQVQGTANANVVMTSNEASPAIGDWDGIRVRAARKTLAVKPFQYAQTFV